jgi:hypothetical protein
MTTRIHTELRNLSLAYYRGWIQRDKYLSIRQKYLQSITNDETPAAIDPKKIAPPKKKTSSTTTYGQKSSGNKTWLLMALLISVLLLVVIGVYFSMNSEPPKLAPAKVMDTAPVKPTAPAKPIAPEKPQPLTDEQRFNAFLSDNFISKRTWEQDALISLKLKWLGLSQEQQNTVRETTIFKDFSGALIERIVDERKLNNIVPSDYELELMTAAKNMGMINAIPDQ